MFLKAVGFVLLLQIAVICGEQEQFRIKNKKTGLVLNANQTHIGIGHSDNKTSQLWTLESSSSSGRYFLHNVDNGKVLDASPETKVVTTWPKNNGTNQRWRLALDKEYTRLNVEYYPNSFLVYKNGKVQLLYGSEENEDRDIWILVHVDLDIS